MGQSRQGGVSASGRAVSSRALIVRPADDTAIDAAAELLRHGALVAFPTETVYGLGADATDATALGRIFTAKGRPPDHPLIVHLAAADQLDHWSENPSPVARRLAEAFWPGPLTIVVPRRHTVSPAATGGKPTVGLRVPDHPVALALLERAGRPLAAPSANRFGRVSPTTAADVAAEFAGMDGGPDLVLDGGACRVGVESTIVEVLDGDPVLLRPGGIPVEFIEDVLGCVLRTASGPARASGMLASHYAPSAAVELVEPGDPAALAAAVAAALALGRSVAVLGLPSAGSGWRADLDPAAVVLDPVANTEEYAQVLYRRLREADRAGVEHVVALLPDPDGLGRAVRDRLRKAAAPRP